MALSENYRTETIGRSDCRPIVRLSADTIVRWDYRPNPKNYKWLLNPVWYRMLYSCTHVPTVGVKVLTVARETPCCGKAATSNAVSGRSKGRVSAWLPSARWRCRDVSVSAQSAASSRPQRVSAISSTPEMSASADDTTQHLTCVTCIAADAGQLGWHSQNFSGKSKEDFLS